MSDGAKRAAKPSSTFHFIAGLSSGFTSAILLQPADLLKTRVQQSTTHSLVAVLRDIARSNNPLRQLWRGTLPSTIRTSVGSALYFTTLERLRRALARAPALASTGPATATTTGGGSSALPKLSSAANLATGALARASVGFLLMPITVLKVRYESSLFGAYSSMGLLGAARDMLRREGLRGFWAGAGATAVRDAPYAGLYVAFYEYAKGAVGALVAPQAPGAQDDANAAAAAAPRMAFGTAAAVNFASGALAAALATTATNPPDAIKTRLQLEPLRYRNSAVAARRMWADEGWRCFFDGLALRVARKALSSALAWTVYEELVRKAEVVWVRRPCERDA